MSGAALAAQTALRWPLSVIGQVADTYRLAVAMAWAAPAIVALVVVPEATQHVAEVRMGMFVTGDTIDPGRETQIRMTFGAMKIAGLMFAMFLTLRFRLAGSDKGRALTISLPGIGRFVLALAVVMAVDLVALLFTAERLPFDSPAARAATETAFDVAQFTLQALLLLWLIGTVAGDRAMTIRRSVRLGIRNIPRAIILVPAAFLPASLLHQQMHVWAKGAEPVLVWALMAADSLLVGLLATATGCAFYVFYRDAVASRPS